MLPICWETYGKNNSFPIHFESVPHIFLDYRDYQWHQGRDRNITKKQKYKVPRKDLVRGVDHTQHNKTRKLSQPSKLIAIQSIWIYPKKIFHGERPPKFLRRRFNPNRKKVGNLIIRVKLEAHHSKTDQENVAKQAGKGKRKLNLLSIKVYLFFMSGDLCLKWLRQWMRYIQSSIIQCSILFWTLLSGISSSL